MGVITIYLENGFDHDRVRIDAGGTVVERTDVSTRYQIGLADQIDVPVADGGPVPITIALPDRGLTAQATIETTATPHLRVDVTAEPRLSMTPEHDSPRFA
jgi:hypothetical protein